MTKREVARIYKKTHFNIDMFGISAYFTTSREEYRHMVEYIGGECVDNVAGRCELHENEDGSVILFICAFDDYSESTLVHECTHAALFISSAIGHKLRYDCEIIPYLVGYIYDKCKDKT